MERLFRNNRLKAFTVCILAAVIVLAGTCTMPATASAAAISFSDVDSAHWAKSNIEFAAGKGIVNGYYDEYSKIYTFRPEKPVTYEEAAAMLWRAMVAAGIVAEDDALTANLLQQYETVLTAADISSWAAPYIARLLELGVMDESQLSAFVGSEHIGNPALRETIAVWTAKALGGNKTGIYYLPYMDAGKIHEASRPYIDMLYRKGIMQGSLEYDGYVYFKPDAGVKRCEFAAIANRVFENIASSKDAAKECAAYSKTTELASLYAADRVLLVTNGTEVETVSGIKAVEKARNAGSFVLSSIAVSEKETAIPQVHLDTEPAQGSGKVTSLSGNFVGIEIDKTTVYYVKNDKTAGASSLKIGSSIRFIADGVTLIEVE